MAESMETMAGRLRTAWQGRISGCQLGKPVEMLSMREGYGALTEYLEQSGSLPLRDYVRYLDRDLIDKSTCREYLCRSEPDDDINYSMLALLMLEDHGLDLRTVDVARAWLRLLPVGKTYTAERAAYRILLERGAEWFAEGADPGFDLSECTDNPFNDWIGAQIRADVYGWVCPGRPEVAARLARADAALSHQGAGVHGAEFVAALGAALAVEDAQSAFAQAAAVLPADSDARFAVDLGKRLAASGAGAEEIRQHYGDMSPVHTLNNLCVVVWALYSHLDDFDAAIGEAVTAGWDTDCNGATVGGLWGLQGKPIPEHWLSPWQNRVGLTLAGYSELELDELVHRTVNVALKLAA